MLFYTHLLFGILFFLLFREFQPELSTPLFLVMVLFGSILPDIDEPKSRINRWSGILGAITALLSKHRGFFHSLLFIAIVYIVIASVFPWHYGVALVLGFLAHVLSDGLTPMGVTLFYPFSRGRISGPIRTGSFTEKIVMVLLLAIIVSLLF